MQYLTASLLVSTLIFAGLWNAAAQSCAPNASHTLAAQAQTLQKKLLAFPAPDEETDVPQALKPTIHDFKQVLISTVSTAMACDAGGTTDPKEIEIGLATLLHANLPPKPGPDAVHPDNGAWGKTQTGVYGDALTVSVLPVPKASDLRAVQLRYSIECGEDTILVVFRRANNAWQRALVFQNPDLNQISDALGSTFEYLLVPAPQPAMVVVSGKPWCTSGISSLRLNLVTLSDGKNPQRELDHTEHDYRRTEDTKILPEPDGFEIKATVDSVDNDIIMTPGILRYTTTSGRIEQQPVAANVQSFTDMYLMANWEQEKRWSDPAHLATLKSFFDDRDGDGNFTLHLGPVRACTNAPDHFQVDLPTEEEHVSGSLQITRAKTDTWYAQVRQNPHSFTMLDITQKPDPACGGPNLMKPKR